MTFEIVLGIPEVLDYWNDLDKKYESSKLTGKEKILFTKLIKAFRLLETNPRSNSLSTHEIAALTVKYGFKIFQSYLKNNVPAEVGYFGLMVQIKVKSQFLQSNLILK